MNAPVAIMPDRDVEPHKHLLRVEDFIILQERGVFEHYARAELIRGDIYTVNAIYKPHAGVLADLTIDLGTAVRASGLPLKVYSPVSVRLDDYSLPEPDLVIATVDADRLMSVELVRLAVEVADSSLAFDLAVKVPLYANAGIPEFWLVDVAGRKVVCMSDPEESTYRSTDEVAFGQPLMSTTILGLVVDTTHLA